MAEPVGPDLPDGLRTPATLIFADRMERNLSPMSGFARHAHIALRPHAKTHKCREIARRQIALGARGLSVATVGEAEILAQPGNALADGSPDVTDIFVAYPLWADEDLIDRISRLLDRAMITVGADSPEAVRRL